MEKRQAWTTGLAFSFFLKNIKRLEEYQGETYSLVCPPLLGTVRAGKLTHTDG
jgi:hypothetical protein